MRANAPTNPPYSKYLRNLLAQGLRPQNDVYLFMGADGWNKADCFQLSRLGTLCLPYGKSPFDYIWPVNGCDILIFDSSESDGSDIEDFAALLFIHGASIVRYVSHLYKLTVFKKDF